MAVLLDVTEEERVKITAAEKRSVGKNSNVNSDFDQGKEKNE